MWFLFDLVTFACMVFLPFYYAKCSATNDDAPVFATYQQVAISLAKGVAVPLFVWLLMNLGSLPMMPPLTDYVAALRAAGSTGAAIFAQMVLASWVIVPSWSAFICGWCLLRFFRRAEHKEDLIIALVLWSIAAAFLLGFLVYAIGWSASGFVAFLWTGPLAMYWLKVVDMRKPVPTYSKAIAKMKFGKYAEAEQHIIGQLENSQTDFDGWLMLAELYATHFNDLEEAENCVVDLCNQPETGISESSIALHKLADWYLAKRQDPVAARRVLQMICNRMPGTHLSTMAANRIRSLPETREAFIQHTGQRTIALPHMSDDSLGISQPTDTKMTAVRPENSAIAAADAASHAAALAELNQLVDALRQDPNDVAARERIAKVYAEGLGKHEEGIEQLELLIAMPQQAEEKIPQWIHLIAEWQEKHHGMDGEYQETLKRLVRQYPQSRAAFDAQRRLSMMEAQHRIAHEPKLKAIVRVREGGD